jgi:hypothetical protein
LCKIKPPLKNNEPRGRIRQQRRNNAIKQAEAIKTNNEPRAESANNRGSNAIKQAEAAINNLTMEPEQKCYKNRQKPPLITNNEPRGRIRQQQRRQCYQAKAAINN